MKFYIFRNKWKLKKKVKIAYKTQNSYGSRKYYDGNYKQGYHGSKKYSGWKRSEGYDDYYDDYYDEDHYQSKPSEKKQQYSGKYDKKGYFKKTENYQKSSKDSFSNFTHSKSAKK